MTVTKSKLYNRLSRSENTFDVRTTPSTQAGVKIETRGNKKLTQVEIILPSTSNDGDTRMVRVLLSGRQARALFETLNRHYFTR